MKKILFSLCLLLVSLVMISQTTRTIPSGFSLAPAGSATTFNRWGGIIYPVVGYAPSIWLDTITANASSLNIKNIPLIQIGTSDGKNWYRDINLNKWNEMGAGGADGNNYPTSLSFNTGDGVLTIGRNGLSNLIVDLDGRFVGISDTAAISDRSWRTKGNSGTAPTTHFIGTTDNQSVRFKGNNKNSGYIDVTTNAVTAFGFRAGDSTGTGNVWSTYFGYRAGERFKPGVNNVENTAIGAYSQFFATGPDAYENVTVGSFTGSYLTGYRNVLLGASAGNWSTSAYENTVSGNFAFMANRHGDNNTVSGSSSLRGNVDGSGNVSIGSISGTQNTTNIASISVTNGGSGYTTATVVISAPTVLFDPNFNSEQATATATINAGAITAIIITNPGKGYTNITDATGTAVTATITGDGTGATLSVTLQSGDGNTWVGTDAGSNNTTGDYTTNIGISAKNSSQTAINRTSLGAFSYSAQDNSMTLGSINGVNGGTADVNVGIGNPAPNLSSVLDLTSTSRGFLVPRMTTVQRDAIASPAIGLMIYNTTDSVFNYWRLSGWTVIGGGSGDLQDVTDVGNTTTNDIIHDAGSNNYVKMTNDAGDPTLEIFKPGIPNSVGVYQSNRLVYSNSTFNKEIVAGTYGGADRTLTMPNQSGTIAVVSDIPTNLTQFVSQNNWKVFYSNGSGDVVELALGDAGKVLQSNGTSSAPTWETPSGGGIVYPENPGFRLTTESGVPVSTSDRTAQSTIYYTPYVNNTITLYNGSAWVKIQSAEVSLALSGLTSGKNYDVFAWNNGGTLTLELSDPWTDDNTRDDAIVLQDGVPVKSGATTRRLIATIRTTGTNTTEDSRGGTSTQVGGKRFVHNFYNRVERTVAVTDLTDSWSYPTAIWRQSNGASGNKIEYVCGDLATQVDAVFTTGIYNVGSGAANAFVGIGASSTTAPSGFSTPVWGNGGGVTPMVAKYAGTPGLGYHYISMMERGSGGTSTFIGDNGETFAVSGLTVTLQN